MGWGVFALGSALSGIAYTASSVEGLGIGSELRKKVLITVNTALLAPIPSAIVSTATRANPGVRRRMRQP